MRFPLLALVLLVGCGWPTVAPAPREGLSDEQIEAYRALAHALSGFMNARADDVEIDLQLAGILEDVLLHARAVDNDDWRKARSMLEAELGPAKVPSKTVVSVWLEPNAPWRDLWNQGDQLTGRGPIDDIMVAYGIYVVRAGVFSRSDFDLIVPREVNGYALANRIAKVPGIGWPLRGWDLYAWGNSLDIGPGVLVRPYTRPGGWSLRVGVGWGDCLLGCIYSRSFSFEVDANGDTRLVSAEGAPLP